MHNLDICMESSDKMIWYKEAEEVVVDVMKGKCWDLMHEGIPFFYDGTDAYVTRQENDFVIITNGCLATIAPENASPTKKGD